MKEKEIMEKYDKLNRKMNRYFASYFTESPLTSIQALVLHYLISEGAKRDIFPKDLEEFLEIKPSSVTSLIANLERNGYLRRESLPNDGRYKKLVLTDKTFEIQNDISNRINSYMISIFTDISEEDLKVFEKVIAQMTKNIS